MAVHTEKHMVDCVPLHEGRPAPLHVDLTGRADRRLHLIECTPNFIHHDPAPRFSFLLLRF